MGDRRARYDPDDYHDPTAGLGGAPPARSALGLRLVLAVFGLVVCVGGVIAFLAIDVPAGGVVMAALAAIAAVDIVVIAVRIRRER